MTRSALFLSPHLDDVAFSCGGTLLNLLQQSWDVLLCTVFTASVLNPQGFALACQLDKGLSADVDYMAIRRNEDWQYAAYADTNFHHLEFREAPHRGYSNVPDLFNGVHEGDDLWRELAIELQTLASGYEVIFAPQGLGNHVDHLQTIKAVIEAGLSERTIWYCDTPYAIRNADATHSPLLPSALTQCKVPIDLTRKIGGCRAYKTQVPFQFGSQQELARQLEQFHRSGDGYVETLLLNTDANTSPFQSRTIIRGI